MTDRKLARALTESDAYDDYPDGAIALWQAGFRPMEAHQVRDGDTVAYAVTLFGARAEAPMGGAIYGGTPRLPFHTGQVMRAEHVEEGVSVEVAHTTDDGGESMTEADWEDEVWVKR